MGMNVGNSSGGDEADVMLDVNTTPLIDVMLVLLVMLIITIPIQLHSINLDMPPPSNQQPLKDPIVHEVFIDFDGTVMWDGTPVANHADLEAKLSQVVAEPDQPEVHIKPNKLVEYGNVAAVMAAAQRLGVKKMAMVGNEQFLN
ncbi:biopolymer transporter ExbD [Pelomonas sp. CA6]|uniref:ExbD/TolR family protein n=1 Tax=Pelomonas sp. CA6 TaxID=2907999 RepID=UPI001F4C006E|nr:biopolymer transporter ExbD [Pelomonas sp. CA6]MCH7345751.1 biopolymer transporter ExbD [Pelomonas sp. CA6]